MLHAGHLVRRRTAPEVKMPRALVLILAFALAGCGGRTATDARVTKLEQQVAALNEQVYLDRDRITRVMVEKADKPLSSAGGGFELVVSWHDKGGNDYRRTYANASICEDARKAVFSENARRDAEALSHAGRSLGSGFTEAANPPPKASAVCLPQ